ncbi:MAG: alpha/beta hydrolase fold domain-containing protein [Syntrophothermus sp.]
MRKYAVLLIIFTSLLSAQQSGSDYPKDTSFTNYSAAVKVYKNFPQAKLVQPALPEGVKAEENITYLKLGERELKADIYRPKKTKKLLPAVIFIHGGGWRSGDRTQEKPFAQLLASKGYVTILADYRLSIEALYPAGVHDIKAAIRWARENAKKYRIDKNRIAVLGTSAGAQMASLMGTTGDNPKFEGNEGGLRQSTKVQAVVNIDGLLDFTHEDSRKYDNDPKKPSAAAQWFGGSFKEKPELWKEASSLYYVDKNTPPFIFINSALPHYHAGRDDMIARFKELNIYYEAYTIPDTPHPFWLFHPWFEQAFDYTVKFLDKVFKK